MRTNKLLPWRYATSTSREYQVKTVVALLLGSGCLEEIEASQCRTLPGSYNGTPTDRVGVDAKWHSAGILKS